MKEGVEGGVRSLVRIEQRLLHRISRGLNLRHWILCSGGWSSLQFPVANDRQSVEVAGGVFGGIMERL